MSTPTDTDTDTATRTITLTGRAPVRIREADWPVIATGNAYHECGQCGQNGHREWTVRVRRHADGRALVYGATTGHCQCQGGYSPTPRPGELLAPGEDLAPAVERVAHALLSGRHLDDDREDDAAIRRLVAEVLAALPAERI